MSSRIITSLLLAVLSAIQLGCPPSPAGTSAPTAAAPAERQFTGPILISDLPDNPQFLQAIGEAMKSSASGDTLDSIPTMPENSLLQLQNIEGVILSSMPTVQQCSDALRNGILPSFHLIAMDPICVVVHKNNPIKNLTTEQLAGIFSGKYSSWQQVTGQNKPIVILDCDAPAGMTELLKEAILPNYNPLDDAYQKPPKVSMDDIPVGIGITSTRKVTPNMKVLQIDGLAATVENVQSGDYRFAGPIILATNGYPAPNSRLGRFISFCSGTTGRKAIMAAGFAPLSTPRSVSPATKPVDKDSPILPVMIKVLGGTSLDPVALRYAGVFYSAGKFSVSILPGAKDPIASLGAKDVIPVRQFPSPDDYAQALDGKNIPVLRIAAFESAYVIVNSANKVSSLTVEQLRDIYSGKIANWKQLGGADYPITRLGRNSDSPTGQLFHAIVMKDIPTKDVEEGSSDQYITARVAAAVSAIGFVQIAPPQGDCKTLAINGSAGSQDDIRGGKYPISGTLYWMTSGCPIPGSPAYDFVNYHQTKQGQSIINECGLTSIKPSTPTTSNPTSRPATSTSAKK